MRALLGAVLLTGMGCDNGDAVLLQINSYPINIHLKVKCQLQACIPCQKENLLKKERDKKYQAEMGSGELRKQVEKRQNSSKGNKASPHTRHHFQWTVQKLKQGSQIWRYWIS